ncbi:MAG: hypothetical protein JF585_04395 [Burkholderiales bacterium]|nr:hypothetical protein [Burkholderiales bacterium]
MRSTVLFLALALPGLAAEAAAQKLPAQFDHNRIHLVVRASDGSPFKAYVDSGGGINSVDRALADRLKLAPAGELKGDEGTFQMVEFPAWLTRAGVPSPPDVAPFHGKLVVLPEAVVPDADVFLGAAWLAGRVWQIDYGRHEMVLAPDWKPSVQAHALPLGFRVDDHGTRPSSMPRITVTVDGKPLDMLLDTGAMIPLAPDGAAAFHVAPGTIVGGGFIMKTVFDEWHGKHPEWRVIEHAEATRRGDPNAMIEVPQVTVAGYTVGPVWFARRHDANFTGSMATMMDKPIVGAFGGSGLQYFRLVVDYPKATAWLTPLATPK